ncbi:MAG TPA: DapH/DapD/GlmU-related protein [Elusimicrobiota bacterium]|nr:DapH/DapD/GlmU-related protein [Elusimicrobiota bacterium]
MLPGWLVSILGPFAFALDRVAQEYAARRELAKADELGKGVSARAGLFIWNRGRVRLGRNVSIGANVDITCYEGGSVEIGDDVFIGNGCVIASGKGNVRIGSDCLIAEGVSIRAGDHGLEPDRPMREQATTVRDIRIGRDVWLAKGVAVLAGTEIADGCVVGANAVAMGTTEPYGIYVGVPIRKAGDRRQK